MLSCVYHPQHFRRRCYWDVSVNWTYGYSALTPARKLRTGRRRRTQASVRDLRYMVCTTSRRSTLSHFLAMNAKSQKLQPFRAHGARALNRSRGWEWVYSAVASPRAGVKSGTDTVVFQGTLGSHWTEPHEVPAVGCFFFSTNPWTFPHCHVSLCGPFITIYPPRASTGVFPWLGTNPFPDLQSSGDIANKRVTSWIDAAYVQ